MGRRTATETLVGVIEAFYERDTWTQATLAKRLDVEPRAARAALELLVGTKCFPLQREQRGRQVEWKLPRGFRPGGLVIAGDDLAPLARLVSRAPKSGARDKILAKVLACMPPRMPPVVDPERVATPARSDFEDRMLAHAESALAQRSALSVRYYTASRGVETQRVLSIQHIEAGTRLRLIAYCHTAKEIRTFRVDGIRGAVIDPGVPYVHVDADEIAAYVAATIDGYHGPRREPVACRFSVRDPEAGWVERNLFQGMVARRVASGIEVTIKTTAIEQIARFVVGLGAAAVSATPELREAVRTLAQGALTALGSSPTAPRADAP